MDDFSDVASLLAEVFLRGKWSSDELLERGRKVTGRRFEKSLKSIVAAVISEFGANPPVPVQQVLARFLASHPRMERLQEVATKIHRALADLPKHKSHKSQTITHRNGHSRAVKAERKQDFLALQSLVS